MTFKKTSKKQCFWGLLGKLLSSYYRYNLQICNQAQLAWPQAPNRNYHNKSQKVHLHEYYEVKHVVQQLYIHCDGTLISVIYSEITYYYYRRFSATCLESLSHPKINRLLL